MVIVLQTLVYYNVQQFYTHAEICDVLYGAACGTDIRWCLRMSSSSYVVYGLNERVPGIIPCDGRAGIALVKEGGREGKKR